MAPEAPVAEPPAGAVRGLWRGERGSPGASAAFLGIPFAQPPVGALRFAAPVRMEPWEGVRDAVAHGATAQRWKPDRTVIPEPSIPGDSILNVNVFTPRPGSDGAPLPVLVWIHGGGYTIGSPASPWYDGRAFNRDGVVTVTISYRLGFDGFGWIDGGVQNRGVLDWIAALEWVRDNVAAFGGDPGRVTIAGQSAGGGAVLTLLGMPAAQGLFHRAIALSPAVADIPLSRARETSARLAGVLGVEPTLGGFRSAPQSAVGKHQTPAGRTPGKRGVAALREALQVTLPYGPIVEGEVIPRPTPDSFAAGVGRDIPLVLGTTDDEFSRLTHPYRAKLRWVPAGLALALLGVPRAARGAYLRDNRGLGGTPRILGRYLTDAVFRSELVRLADARGDAATWAYRFAWASTVHLTALHCLDVPFFFDCLDAEGVAAIAGDAPPQALADSFHGAAAGFVRGDDPGWPAWSAHPGATRLFGGAQGAPDILPDGYESVRALV